MTVTMGPDVEEALAEIVRVSRDLGSDPSLVLHGGGNTSIKATGRDITGDAVDLVMVKGSGWNLGTIEAAGFAPLRRERLAELLQLDELDDPAMVNELRQASLDATAPTASIEALLHAYLPGRVVLHSHADAIVALTNRDVSAAEIADALGDGLLVLPYVMPGFPLARLIARTDVTGVDAIVLRNHGLFTFGDDPDAVLRRHRDIVARAGAVAGVNDWGVDGESIARRGVAIAVATLRREISDAAGFPMHVRQSTSSRADAFSRRDDVAARSTRGTATPEHVLYTKREPMVGRDVAGYADAYRAYVQLNAPRAKTSVVELDPAPRVIHDAELGFLVAGETVKAMRVTHDVALHTMDIVDAADGLGGYRSLDPGETFDIEYWSLEQAKLAGRTRRPLTGEVAIVTGAASGIGRAVAERLLTDGAAVVGVDLNPDTAEAFDDEAWRGVVGDVSDGQVLEAAVDRAVRDFGGVDMVVIAAGIFLPSQPIGELDDGAWERAFRVNVTAPARLLRATQPYLALAPRGGRVVLVSTKNVAAPGPGVAAYSASKAAAAQLARVAALEWAEQGIRVNQVEPDAVFDTAIWTPELLEARAAHYGLTVDEYRTRNLLHVEVTSATVAEAVAAFCESFSATTGAHLSVDGGNDRVI
ncbi:SDR family NAD(P)-dependent oxidoreductase [Microbacterium sp. UBA3394]|uniref:SDR family NAD(P)-dependent oxidoreductase n=1 Tax=Microbacterium sp. UBA3394 TaxID=1946945 RepID=UPI00257D8E05|nr:SDR family NAD(P)-dependent oxidoreductase [Microbacterium sp. UBA3394]|tara:strand:- start:608 stop:2542 length:1935 start_codon:yes stop_codon:yes gene_type:complete